MATGVAQRRNEIGIRMALGAQISDIMSLIFSQGLRLAAFGLAAGLLSAVAATRLLTVQLYDTAPTEPLAYVVTIVALGGAASLACYFPARRATKVDPVVALRAE
jgi:ABC-type antimicrobial peptide transport system permease subunit